MEGVKSASFKNIYLPRGDSKSPKPVICNVGRLAELITRKDEIKADQAIWLMRVDRVNNRLARLSPQERDILTKVYIEKINTDDVLREIYSGREMPYMMKFRRYIDELVWKCVK